jgi:hypothetical protein
MIESDDNDIGMVTAMATQDPTERYLHGDQRNDNKRQH